MSFHPKYSSKHLLAGKDHDSVVRLQHYTEHCRDRYIQFAREVGRVSTSVSRLRDSVKSAPWQRYQGDGDEAVDVHFEDYAVKAVAGFASRTTHYAADSANSLNFFRLSIPHHAKKIDHLVSSCEKS